MILINTNENIGRFVRKSKLNGNDIRELNLSELEKINGNFQLVPNLHPRQQDNLAQTIVLNKLLNANLRLFK